MRIFDAADLGAAIRLRRKELGFTQQQLAEYCGCGKRFISELERGKPTIQLEKALEVVALTGLDIDIAER